MIRLVMGTLALARCTLVLAALVLMPTAFAVAAEQVDLLLVLSSDVSRSVDHPKFLLQREGYAAAISDPVVMEAIKSGPHQRIAVCFVEWADRVAETLPADHLRIDITHFGETSREFHVSSTGPRSAAIESRSASVAVIIIATP